MILTIRTKYRKVLTLSIALVLSSIFIVKNINWKSNVQASTVTITSRVDFDDGYYANTDGISKEGEIKLTPDGSWSPTSWKTPNITLSNGTAIGSDGNYIYVLPNTDNYFMRYLPTENKWEHLADAPLTAYVGSDMVHLGDYLYVTFGGYQNTFYRYSITNNSWEKLTDTPDLINQGGSLSSDGTYVYALRGQATSDFWRYDPDSNTWMIMSSTPASIYLGSSSVYKNGYIYALRGYNRNTLYRYSIASNTWDTMANAPTTFYDNHNIDVAGDYIYVARDRNTNTFYRYKISTNSWETLTNTPQNTRYVGVVYNEADDQLYVFRGNGQYDFWKYDRDNDLFTGPGYLPANPGSGADLINYNGYIYYIRGYNSTSFYRYKLSDGSWETLTSSPASFNDDTKGVEVGGKLYFFRGSNTTDFYSYDIASDSWSSLADAPATVRYGGTLSYPGSGDYIYATRGNYTRYFWRYSISTDTWDDTAVADLPNDAEAAYGARLIADGSDNNIMYYISGARTGQILEYNISSDTWTDIGNLPYAPFWGTDAVYYNNKLYIQAGYYKTDLWEFNLSDHSWRWFGKMQSKYAYDLGPYNGGSLEYVNSGGNNYLYSIWGNNINNFTVFSFSGNTYNSSGTWTSDIISLTYVASWTSLTATSTTPGDSSISFETKTSTDSAHWSNWQSVSSNTIQSPIGKYIQVRATLNSTSDFSQTPVLKDIDINYVSDENPPTSPTSFHGYSRQISGAELTSGSTYHYQHPYFTWTESSDSEASVAGYYVYFGTNSSADPETDGNFQTNVNYLSNVPLASGTYYLRVKAKDSSGNISSAATGFIYVYQGLSTKSLSVQNDGDFTGTLTKVSTSDGQIKLSNKSGFWREESLTNPPGGMHYGAHFAYVSSTGKLYTFRGANNKVFYEYDTTTDTWTQLADAPANVYIGGGVVEGPSGYLYGWAGNNTSSFWRYDIANNTWSDGDASDLPQSARYGSSAIYDGSEYIYFLRGNNDDSFFRYDVLADMWESLTSVDFGAPSDQVNNLVNPGGDLAYDGDDTIYAIQGNTRTGFASYSISSGEWTVLPKTPAMMYLGAEIEYDSTSNAVYLISGWAKPFFFKYDVGTQQWTRLQDGPMTFYYGSTMRNVGGNLYITRGYNSTSFYKYNIARSSWLTPTRGIFGGLFRGSDYRSFSYGSDIVKGSGNYYYITRGNYDNLFVRWDAGSGATVKLSDFPGSFYVGGALGYDSTHDKVYAVASSYTRKLYVYDTATDNWSEVTTDPLPTDPSSGTSFAYDGSRYLYWLRGGGSYYFYRYDTQGTAGSRWESLHNLPAGAGYGAQVIYKNGYIYTTRGNNVTPNPLYRYDPSSDTWTTLNSIPDRVYNDGFLVDGGGDYLYACRGGNTKACYRYSITNDSWEAIADAPDNIYYGGAAVSDGLNKIYMITGPGTHSYNDGIYTYVMETSSSAFESSGNYVSQSHDLTRVYQFANLDVTYTSANNATMTVYTRTSDDNNTWSSWSECSSQKQIGTHYYYKINSSAKRYIQVKFELTSGDNIYSGTVDGYTINYYQDLDNPVNPTDLNAYSTATKSATLTDGNWYNFSAPVFDWPDAEDTNGATDTATGSGVMGYYVYFGTDENADASASGSFITDSEYTPSSLTSGETYYLKIKTKDNAGNISSQNWDAFTYKYDFGLPENPNTIIVNPAGYTNVNNFAFSWTGATDSASLISEYCYKTGTSSGTLSTDTCIHEASVSGALAYKTGTNTFYLRVKDNAGNYSSSYTTASFYYSADAPSAPQNLRMTHPDSSTHNTLNEFAFAWDPPELYHGEQSALRYYYSVNTLPTVNNVVGPLSVTYLTSGPYATQKGKNTLYVIAKEQSGNIDYNNYSSIDFYADTSAPGVPRNLDISDVSIKETKSWRLALSWDVPVSSGSGVSYYRIFRSKESDADCNTDSTDFSSIATTTQTSYIDTNLTQETKYYCVKSCNSTNECSAVSDTVHLYPDGRWRVAATMTASPSASVKTKSAIITWSTNRTSNSFIKYGASSGSYGEEVGSSEQVTEHSITLTGLNPGTTYYYQALWTDEDGNIGKSDELSFTTNPAPFISSVKVNNISIHSAYVTFTVKNGIQSVINYGETTSYGSSETIATSKTESTYTVALSDLTEGTLYHLQIVAKDEESNEFAGDDYTFETLPIPKVENLRVQQIIGMPTATLRLLWLSNSPISSIVTYYPTNSPERSLDKINLVLTRKHETIIKGLKDNTEYTLIVRGKDSANNEADKVTKVIKTSMDIRPPEIQNLNIDTTITGSGEDAKAQIVVSWDTDEPATTQVEYAQGTGATYSKSTQEDRGLTLNHTVTITGLSPAKIYHLRVLSKDKSDNLAKSLDNVIVTPKSAADALNLVIEKLSKTFGFLKSLSIFQ